MTQYLQQQDADEDQRTMRRLGTVIGAFVIATAILAITVGALIG